MAFADQTIEVAAGLILQNGRYLIARRNETAHLGGLWEFPGGKRRPDESLGDCLRRELKEELDITVWVGEELKVVRHAYPDRTVEIHFFRCAMIEGTPRAPDGGVFCWATPAELPRFRFPEANATLIRELQSHP